MKPYKQQLRNLATRLLQDGHSVRHVASQLEIGKSTVQEWSRGILKDQNKSLGGRPKKLSTKDALYIKSMFVRGQVDTAVQAHKDFNKENQDPVSVSTIKRALHDTGLHAKKVIKKPLLTKRHRKARLEFARKYEDFTEDDWKRVIFTDESKINRLHSDGKKYVWIESQKDPKIPASDIDPKRVLPTVKHGGGNIMVWSCMTWYGPGFITKIDGGLNAELYVEILKDEFMQTVEYYGIDKDTYIFQQDNDPKHTSKLAKAYLESQGLTEERGRYLFWPAQSPDLNPIEHLWEHLKRELMKYPTHAKSAHENWERTSEVWGKISPEVCQNLIRSMPDRIQAVIRAKGGPTKY